MCIPENRSGTRISTCSPTSSARCVAEHLLHLGVDQGDDAVAVDDDHAVGRGLEEAAEELGLAVLVVGLAQPDRHHRAPVGVRGADREVDGDRGAVGVVQLRVADGDLDAVGDHRAHGDLLERVHRLTAEVLDADARRSPRRGTPTISLAASLANSTTPDASLEDEGLVGLQHRLRERAEDPGRRRRAAAACGRSALIVEPEAAVIEPATRDPPADYDEQAARDGDKTSQTSGLTRPGTRPVRAPRGSPARCRPSPGSG